MIDTIECSATVKCEYQTTLRCQCPIVDETDQYEVVITWTPIDQSYEKHALIDTVDSFSGCEISHEELTESLYDQLSTDGVTDLKVRIRDTAHMDMTVMKP